MLPEARRAFLGQARVKHLSTRLAICGACGGTFTAAGRHYLGCGTARRLGACRNRRSIPRQALENIILDGLKNRLMAPELVQAFIAAFNAEVNRALRDKEGEVSLKRKELEEV